MAVFPGNTKNSPRPGMGNRVEAPLFSQDGKLAGNERLDDEASENLKILLRVGVLFLLALCSFDFIGGRPLGLRASVSDALVFVTALFLVAAVKRVSPANRQQWLWVCGITVMLTMTVASWGMGNPAIRYSAIILCPGVTAAFTVWGWHRQWAMIAVAFVIYVTGELVLPIGGSFEVHWFLAIMAALALSGCLVLFLERYRCDLIRRVDELESASEQRTRQISGFAHDIRNPLAAVSGLVDLLMENHLENEQRNHLLARVRSATSSLDLLVKNLADLYLIDDKRLKPRCRMIDPKAVLAGVADRYELEARLKGIELRPEFEGISSAYLDPMHLERIVTNLLASAFRRTTAGVVRLRACSRGADFIIEISDSGAEATPAEIEGVFARPDLSAGAEDERSPALSRYIAKCLVEADGGRILATSNDGAGLRLTIQLPAAIALAA